jgi:hypothetical protein
VGAVVDPAQVRHDRVEGPHVHKVEQLREQLDGQGRVHTTLPADQFKSRVTKIFPGKNFRETQVSTKNWKNLLQFEKEIKNSELNDQCQRRRTGTRVLNLDLHAQNTLPTNTAPYGCHTLGNTLVFTAVQFARSNQSK